jgi:hypothetical protein
VSFAAILVSDFGRLVCDFLFFGVQNCVFLQSGVCDFVLFDTISCVVFSNNPIIQTSCFCYSSVLFPNRFLKDFQRSFFCFIFDRWIVLLVI